MTSTPLALFVSALFIAPAFAQDLDPRTASAGSPAAQARANAPEEGGDLGALEVTESTPRPGRVKRTLLPGVDDALPAPRGEVFFQPRDTEPFTGRSDAEVAAAPPIDPLAVDPHSVLYFTEHADGTWVRGRTYKARVNEDGFRYIPFLGSSAPRNWPVDFRLESAELGGEPLMLTENATVERSGDRFVLDRGPVDVLYDVTLESVEQSFAVDVAGAAGDLVLELSVVSDLEGSAHTASPGAFRFSGPSGGLDYGTAVVFDGAGRSASVPATLEGDRLQLTVPAAFLAAASGPILVDPVLTSFAVDTVTGDQRDIDIAYDRTGDAFTYVYEDTFSGTDNDIYSRTFDSGGTLLFGVYIDSSDEDWIDPSVANLNLANKNLVVASRISALNGSSEIVGRIMDVTAGTVDPEIVIGEGTASWDNFRPDVGGNSSGALATVFLVVWERAFTADTQPRYRVVFADGTLGNIQFFDNGNFTRTGVVISESTGDPATVNVWNVAYRSRDNSTGAVSLRGLQINAGGAIVNGPANIVTLPSGQDLNEVDVSEALSLDGYAPTYVISYDEYSTPIEDTYLVFCRNNQRVNTISLQESEHAELARQQVEARLSTTAEDFMVTYLEEQPSGIYDAFITTFDLAEGAFAAISERRTRLGSTDTSYALGATPGEGVPLASRFSGGFYTSRISATAWVNFNTNDLDALSATHIADAGFSQGFQYCYGNPNSTGDRGFLSMFGDRSTTATKFLEASALPPNTFGYFFCGPGFSNVAGPGGSQGVLCVGGAIGRYSNAVASTGANGRLALAINPTMLAQPNGPVAAMAGQLWQFQCWHRDSAGGSATSNFTNAVTTLFR
ncbi:hypothetical protein Poly30_53440 [Planctomycetes bacterium Poly30]|uniref:Uncharacterized protein n=1 Tax=Saltatorellus ferox TaxID=2528018 RepID=A0A518F0C5_9BACT|nr:hypothetical protein Poly30_53440 [Planctomycetes bacterium Poly30]